MSRGFGSGRPGFGRLYAGKLWANFSYPTILSQFVAWILWGGSSFSVPNGVTL